MKSKTIFLVAIFCLLLIPASAGAETLSELLPEMLTSHERLQSAMDTEEAGLERYRASRTAWYPKLDLTGDVAREDTTTSNVKRSKSMERNIEKFRATQQLWDFGATDGAIKNSMGLWQQAESSRTMARQGLILEGVSAYLQLIKAAKTLGFALQSEDNIKKQTGIEESLVKRGAGLSSDVLQAKAQLAQAAALRVVDEGLLENARSRFNAVFRKLPDDDTVLALVYPQVPYTMLPGTLDDAIVKALSDNPSIHVAKNLVTASEGAVDMAESSFYPSFNAFWEWWRKENDGGNRIVKWEQRLGVEFSYNLFNGGGDQATLRASKRDRSSAVNSVKDVERTVEEQVRVAWQNLITARAKAEWYRNQANISEEFLRLARKERKLGNRSLLDVLQAEVGLNQARSGALGAEIDQMLQVYTLLHAMGRLDLDLFAAK
ncbi:TolC family protein [Desulfocurvus sp. DL9XJH121]